MAQKIDYWAQRTAKAQEKLTSKSIKETNAQLIKYYQSAHENIIGQFLSTYNKVLSSIEDGREPTPADLYKLDKYWKMEAQLKNELQRLGDKQVKLLSKQFTNQYINVYNSLAIPTQEAYSTIDEKAAQQFINTIWCADGKTWSSRVWSNTEKLADVLNEHLLDCVKTGKTTKQLKQLLMNDFNVSFNNADMLVRTELAHIQTQAAQQRYKDYGIKQVEVFVDEDERTCPICAKHEGERYGINEKMPIPFHPRCRCCVIPVIEKS